MSGERGGAARQAPEAGSRHRKEKRIRRREAPELASDMRRLIRNSLGRMVREGDIDALPELVGLESFIEEVARQAVHELRARHGYSFTDVGARLGMTRQSARERFGDRSSLSGESGN